MAVNPALTSGPAGTAIPRVFENETFLLHREGMELEIDIPPGARKESYRGLLYVTNIRLVFVADKRTESFQGFDIPLVYLRKEKFNQPIFGCNNLSGDVFSVAGGGPASTTPPFTFRLFFKQGGCGTFLPLFFNLLEQVRGHQQQMEREASETIAAIPVAEPVAHDLVRTAYIDPSDPCTLYITQPESMHSAMPTEKYPAYANKSD